jgi:hypothetical protein
MESSVSEEEIFISFYGCNWWTVWYFVPIRFYLKSCFYAFFVPGGYGLRKSYCISENTRTSVKFVVGYTSKSYRANTRLVTVDQLGYMKLKLKCTAFIERCLSVVHWVPGVLSPGPKRGRDVTLTTHPPLVPKSGMSRSYTSSASVACSGTALVLAYL